MTIIGTVVKDLTLYMRGSDAALPASLPNLEVVALGGEPMSGA